MRPNAAPLSLMFVLLLTLLTIHFVAPPQPVSAGEARAPAQPASPLPLPDPITTNVNPDQPANLSYTDPSGGSVMIHFPAGAIDSPATFVYQPLHTPYHGEGGLVFAGQSFTLEAYINGEHLSPFVFDTPITAIFTYTDADVAGIDEADLQLLTYDTATASWTTDGITVIEHNLDENYLVVTLAHLTEFAVTAPGDPLFLPIIIQ